MSERSPVYPDGNKIAFHAAVGDAIRAHREARGLSLMQLAETAGVSKSTLGKVEAGEAACPAYVVMRVARACGCTTDALLMIATG